MTRPDPAAVTGHAYGVPVRIRVAPSCRIAFRRHLPPDWTPGPVGIDAPSFEVLDESQIPSVLGSVELHVAEHARDLIFIHSGAVAIDGKGIVLPGRTMAGKSTLVAALVAAGATYYSDEYAILDNSAQLRAYPRDLALRGTDGHLGTRIDPASLGTVGSEPVPIALIAHLSFTGEWTVAELAPARRVLALMDNAVAARSRTAEVLARCGAVAEAARGITGSRADADAAAKRLIDLVRQS